MVMWCGTLQNWPQIPHIPVCKQICNMTLLPLPIKGEAWLGHVTCWSQWNISKLVGGTCSIKLVHWTYLVSALGTAVTTLRGMSLCEPVKWGEMQGQVSLLPQLTASPWPLAQLSLQSTADIRLAQTRNTAQSIHRILEK